MTNCPICNSPSHFFISRKDRFAQEYKYVRCEKCRFLFDEDVFLNKKKLQEKINNIYRKNYFETIDTGWKMRGDIISKRIKLFLKIFRVFKKGKKPDILDYGGGNGYISSKIGANSNVFYYDRYEKPTCQGNYKVLEKPEKADIVCAIELAEHITDIGEWDLLDKLCSSALIFTTEVSDGISGNHLKKWTYLNPDAGHISIYSFRSLYLLAKKYGFFYFFFPSKSFHIFLRSPVLSKINFVKVESGFYSFLRMLKHIFNKQTR